MTSRETILDRIRASTADVPSVPAEVDAPIAWEYGRPTSMPDVLAQFVERVEDYRAVVVRVAPADVAEAISAALRGAGADSVVLPEGLPEEWTSSIDETGARVLRDDPPLPNSALNEVAAVVTSAAVGVAETGTIVLDHAAGQGRRALSLVPDFHVCVVLAEQVVSDVPESVIVLADALRAGRPLTWISGPSATSDIELSRVEGVHGPRTLHVVLVG